MRSFVDTIFRADSAQLKFSLRSVYFQVRVLHVFSPLTANGDPTILEPNLLHEIEVGVGLDIVHLPVLTSGTDSLRHTGRHVSTPIYF